jgi:hypothetical protein
MIKPLPDDWEFDLLPSLSAERIDREAKEAQHYRRELRRVKCPCTQCSDLAAYYEQRFERHANTAAQIACDLRIAVPYHADIAQPSTLIHERGTATFKKFTIKVPIVRQLEEQRDRKLAGRAA